MKTKLIAQAVDKEVIRALIEFPALYIDFRKWNLDSFQASFEDVPAPWPLSIERAIDEAALRRTLSDDSDDLALDRREIAESVSEWGKPKNFSLLVDMLCSSCIVDWYYKRAVLIPSKSNSDLRYDALKTVYSTDGWTRGLAFESTIAGALGWCGVDALEEGWTWIFMFSPHLLHQVDKMISSIDARGRVGRLVSIGEEIWAEFEGP